MSGPEFPLDEQVRMAKLLDEQGEAPADIESLLPAVSRLKSWIAPAPRPGQLQQLLARLEPLMTPQLSPVRLALRERRAGWFEWFWDIGLAQVSMMRLSFWLVSAVITLVGTLAILAGLPVDQSLLVQALGPLLAYWGTISAFRGVGTRTLEFELACPPSLAKLTLVRLVLVLSYDLGLGLVLSLALWSHGGESFLALTLHWLMPLLLVTGAALLLSIRLKIINAATTAYVGWLVLLVIVNGYRFTNSSLRPVDARFEIGLGLAGLLFLALALWQLRYTKVHWLPRN